MTILNQTIQTAEYLVSEAEGYRSRDVAVVAATEALVAGTVLAQPTAGGSYVALDVDAEDGTEVAKAVLYEGLRAGQTAERTITARDSEVGLSYLTFPEGITQTQTDTAVAELAAVGIITR